MMCGNEIKNRKSNLTRKVYISTEYFKKIDEKNLKLCVHNILMLSIFFCKLRKPTSSKKKGDFNNSIRTVQKY